MKMNDSRFMTASEKEKVLKHLAKFVKSRFSQEAFTKALYNHFYLHCGFIAHYDQHGFYDARFGSPEDMRDTINTLLRCSNNCSSDYQDINSAIAELIGDSI